ncbi:MAG TPA: MFS transporter [Gaiellaceae bacterium]|nr:MFS transporter [Gaiellaceae bacterium]
MPEDGVKTRASVLRSRPIAALLTAEVLSTTGSQMTWLALPWFVLVTSGSKQMALVVAAEAAGYAVFGIPSGSLLQRLGAQRTMRVCDAVRAPLMLLVPLLHWSGDLTLPVLALLAFAFGAAGTPYPAAQRVVVAETLDEEEASVERANALLQGATRVTMLFGPALGGVLIASVGAPIVLVVDAATYVVAFVLVTLFVPVSRAAREDDGSAGGLLAGVRYLLRDPLMRGWTTAIVVGDASFSVLFVAIPVLVVTHYGADPRLAGAFMGAWGVGAVAGNVAAYRSERIGGLRQAPPLVLVQAAALWVLVAPVPAAAVAGALALSGVANGLINPTLHAFLTLRPPVAIRAKVLTATFTASVLGTPIALALAAPAFAAYGSRHVVAVAAAGQLLAMAYAALVTLRYLAREPELA